MKVYLIAGEPSGDLLGSRLMRALKKKTNGEVEFFGVGGDTMEENGLKSLFDISDLAIMGLMEVIPSIPKVLRLIKNTVADIEKVQPDIVITIDSWSFSSRVHKILRKKKTGIPQVHYVAPQVWAWKKKRAKTMHKYVDHLMTLLPQEPKYFAPYGLDVEFVGHPVIESDVVKGSAEEFYLDYDVPLDKKVIAILPGSRKNEVARLLPIFMEAAEKLYAQNDDFYFVIPTVKTVSQMVKNMTENAKIPLVITESEKDRYNAFKAAKVAMAASGTVALELAISDVPHIIAYKVSEFTAMILRRFMHIQFVNLSNILLGREIIPEILQERCVAGNLVVYLNQLLRKEDLYETQMNGFAKLRSVLGMGEQMPSEKAADVVLKIIQENANKS